MKRIILTLITAAFAVTAMAQTQPDAEYNLIRRSYKTNNDGSMDIRYRKEIKLLNVCESMKDFSAQSTDKGARLHFILPAGGEFNINPVLFVTKLLEMADSADLHYRIARLRFLLPDGTEFQ